MRTALLPTPGDPFMVEYWLRNFETWRDQVDGLIVLVNGQRDTHAVNLIREQTLAVGGQLVASPESMGHDGAMLHLLELCPAGLFVMCEDDAYVRHPEAVGAAFERIEDGHTDLVGSPRHEDYAGQLQEWGPYTPGDLAELRHGLWPAFLFGRRKDLLKTDRAFSDRYWPRGANAEAWGPVTREAVEFIGLYPDGIHLDTFFATTFQLRAAGLRTELVHHVRTYDAKATEEWLAEDPPWFHVTNLSTLSFVLSGQPVDTVPDIDDKNQWARRIAWWIVSLPQDGAITARLLERADLLKRFAVDAGISDESIRAWVVRLRAWANVPVPV